MRKKNIHKQEIVEIVVEEEAKKQSISTIIKEAYKRTQQHFIRQTDWRNTQMDLLKQRLKSKSQQPIVIREPEVVPKQPTQIEQMEQTQIKIALQPLLQVTQECIVVVPELSSESVVSADTIFGIQEMMNREKTKERIASQYEQFSYYDSLQQEDKLRLLDQQIDESFSFTYHVPSAKKAQIEITYFDFTKLNHFVNDTIINFFLRFAQQELLSAEEASKFKIFSTYHTAKIIPCEAVKHLAAGDAVELAAEFAKNYETILKWTKEDIFSKQFIMFPLHQREHWSLMVVVNAGSLCQGMVDGSNTSDGYFIYFDSLKVLDEKLLFFLKLFLLQVYCHKNGITMTQEATLKAIKNTDVPCYQPLVTRQINYADCGVHLLEYAESFMLSAGEFAAKVKTKNGWNQLQWFPRIMVLTKRLLLKRLLLNLVSFEREQAVTIYKKERHAIYIEFKDKLSEYDKFDEDDFSEYASERNGQKQTLRLEFYLSDEHNFYYSE